MAVVPCIREKEALIFTIHKGTQIKHAKAPVKCDKKILKNCANHERNLKNGIRLAYVVRRVLI